MSITHSYVVQFDQLEEGDNLAAVRGDYVAECLMFGDFELTIGSVEFGEKSVELLGFAIGLYKSVAYVLALGGNKFYSFEECDLKLEVSAAADNQLILAYVTSAGLWKKACIEGLEMLRASTQFLVTLLADAFKRYPDLLRNHSFLISCPLAMQYALDNFRDELEFDRLQYYPSPDALCLGDLSGIEVRRTPQN